MVDSIKHIHWMVTIIQHIHKSGSDKSPFYLKINYFDSKEEKNPVKYPVCSSLWAQTEKKGTPDGSPCIASGVRGNIFSCTS